MRGGTWDREGTAWCGYQSHLTLRAFCFVPQESDHPTSLRPAGAEWREPGEGAQGVVNLSQGHRVTCQQPPGLSIFLPGVGVPR